MLRPALPLSPRCRMSARSKALPIALCRPIWASRGLTKVKGQRAQLSPLPLRLNSVRYLHSTPRYPDDPKVTEKSKDLYENIWTLPNALTVSRLIACPFLGYFIVHNQMGYAVALLAYAGVTDLVDGWLARKYRLESVMGSILDPAADKALVTTLTVTLAMSGLLPVPLAVLIIGRDVALSISAFYWRYVTLPPPKTFTRFWDFSIPSASVHPTTISKYNTFLQLCLMGFTTLSPILPFETATFLLGLQSTVAVTTIWSGLSYLTTSNAVKVLKKS